MRNVCWILVGFLCLASSAFSDDAKVAKPSGGSKANPRLGLVASTLGLAPVPGADNYGPDNKGGLISQQYNNEPQVLIPNGGFQGGPIQGGNGNYGNNNNNGGFQGGNGELPSSSGPCQCVPIEYCRSGGGGLQGGNGEGGTDSGLGPGYGSDESQPQQAGVNPSKDGAGVIDIRIVNRPPGPGGVQCLAGQVFCCGSDNVGAGDGSGGEGGFPSSGYVKCGARKLLNIPGWTAEYGQAQFGAYPWMAVILGKGNNYIGAGALLNSYYVLTAAHKVQAWKPGNFMKVRLGEWNAKDDDEPYKNVEIEVERVDIHPGFNPENLYNDIAVVKLSRPIDINAFPHIKSACLPYRGITPVGKRCWVAGFGKEAFGNGKHSYIMKEVQIPIVESNTCEDLLRRTRLGSSFELQRQSFLCAGGEEGKDACTGDGGSPLVCEINGSWSVVGLVAWGIGCADYAVPGVYVNVPNYVDWIESKIYY